MVILESCRDRSETHPHLTSPVEGEGKGRKLGTIASCKIGYSSPSPGGRELEGGGKRWTNLKVCPYRSPSIWD